MRRSCTAPSSPSSHTHTNARAHEHIQKPIYQQEHARPILSHCFDKHTDRRDRQQTHTHAHTHTHTTAQVSHGAPQLRGRLRHGLRSSCAVCMTCRYGKKDFEPLSGLNRPTAEMYHQALKKLALFTVEDMIGDRCKVKQITKETQKVRGTCRTRHIHATHTCVHTAMHYIHRVTYRCTQANSGLLIVAQSMRFGCFCVYAGASPVSVQLMCCAGGGAD